MTTAAGPLSTFLDTSCFLKGGEVWCWGDNSRGQIGTGTANAFVSPPVPVIAGVNAIAVGGYHACAVMNFGAVTCWGDNTYGQLGIGSNKPDMVSSPSLGPVLGLGPVDSISAGLYHTCALIGWALFCWGDNRCVLSWLVCTGLCRRGFLWRHALPRRVRLLITGTHSWEYP